MIQLPVDMTFTKDNKLYVVPHSDGTVETRRGDTGGTVNNMTLDAAEEYALKLLKQIEKAKSLTSRMSSL